jgi:hypothetical protein
MLYYQDFGYFLHQVCEKKVKQLEVDPEWYIALVLATGHLDTKIDNEKWLSFYLPGIEVLKLGNTNEITGKYDNKKVMYYFDEFDKCEVIFNSVQHSKDYNPRCFEQAIDYLSVNLVTNKKIVW